MTEERLWKTSSYRNLSSNLGTLNFDQGLNLLFCPNNFLLTALLPSTTSLFTKIIITATCIDNKPPDRIDTQLATPVPTPLGDWQTPLAGSGVWDTPCSCVLPRKRRGSSLSMNVSLMYCVWVYKCLVLYDSVFRAGFNGLRERTVTCSVEFGCQIFPLMALIKLNLTQLGSYEIYL